MALINEHFIKLPVNSFFSDMEKRVNSFRVTHPKTSVINLGKEDVTLPLPDVAAAAMIKAVREMTIKETFRGYAPIHGYDFLIDAVLKNDYAAKGVHLTPSEVFITNGAKEAMSNIGDLLRHDNSICVTDPIYPHYVDSNVTVGRAGAIEDDGKWSNVVYMPCSYENNFVPQLPDQRVDIVYLCCPDNPTGTVFSKAELKKWISYALENDTLILYDGTYESYIQDPDIPHSIYEIKGARRVAIEFRSFSMQASFTGIRCGYVVIPKEVTAATLAGDRMPLNQRWERLAQIRFGAASYIAQRAAESLYTTEGKKSIRNMTRYYMDNARLMRETLSEASQLQVYGGVNAPFLWVKTPKGTSSMKFFNNMLYETGVVCTPGVGFGPGGEGYVQITAFSDRKDCEEAMSRIKKWLD